MKVQLSSGSRKEAVMPTAMEDKSSGAGNRREDANERAGISLSEQSSNLLDTSDIIRRLDISPAVRRRRQSSHTSVADELFQLPGYDMVSALSTVCSGNLISQQETDEAFVDVGLVEADIQLQGEAMEIVGDNQWNNQPTKAESELSQEMLDFIQTQLTTDLSSDGCLPSVDLFVAPEDTQQPSLLQEFSEGEADVNLQQFAVPGNISEGESDTDDTPLKCFLRQLLGDPPDVSRLLQTLLEVLGGGQLNANLQQLSARDLDSTTLQNEIFQALAAQDPSMNWQATSDATHWLPNQEPSGWDASSTLIGHEGTADLSRIDYRPMSEPSGGFETTWRPPLPSFEELCRDKLTSIQQWQEAVDSYNRGQPVASWQPTLAATPVPNLQEFSGGKLHSTQQSLGNIDPTGRCQPNSMWQPTSGILSSNSQPSGGKPNSIQGGQVTAGGQPITSGESVSENRQQFSEDSSGGKLFSGQARWETHRMWTTDTFGSNWQPPTGTTTRPYGQQSSEVRPHPTARRHETIPDLSGDQSSCTLQNTAGRTSRSPYLQQPSGARQHLVPLRQERVNRFPEGQFSASWHSAAGNTSQLYLQQQSLGGQSPSNMSRQVRRDTIPGGQSNIGVQLTSGTSAAPYFPCQPRDKVPQVPAFIQETYAPTTGDQPVSTLQPLPQRTSSVPIQQQPFGMVPPPAMQTADQSNIHRLPAPGIMPSPPYQLQPLQRMPHPTSQTGNQGSVRRLPVPGVAPSSSRPKQTSGVMRHPILQTGNPSNARRLPSPGVRPSLSYPNQPSRMTPHPTIRSGVQSGTSESSASGIMPSSSCPKKLSGRMPLSTIQAGNRSSVSQRSVLDATLSSSNSQRLSGNQPHFTKPKDKPLHADANRPVPKWRTLPETTDWSLYPQRTSGGNRQTKLVRYAHNAAETVTEEPTSLGSKFTLGNETSSSTQHRSREEPQSVPAQLQSREVPNRNEPYAGERTRSEAQHQLIGRKSSPNVQQPKALDLPSGDQPSTSKSKLKTTARRSLPRKSIGKLALFWQTQAERKKASQASALNASASSGSGMGPHPSTSQQLSEQKPKSSRPQLESSENPMPQASLSQQQPGELNISRQVKSESKKTQHKASKRSRSREPTESFMPRKSARRAAKQVHPKPQVSTNEKQSKSTKKPKPSFKQQMTDTNIDSALLPCETRTTSTEAQPRESGSHRPEEAAPSSSRGVTGSESLSTPVQHKTDETTTGNSSGENAPNQKGSEFYSSFIQSLCRAFREAHEGYQPRKRPQSSRKARLSADEHTQVSKLLPMPGPGTQHTDDNRETCYEQSMHLQMENEQPSTSTSVSSLISGQNVQAAKRKLPAAAQGAEEKLESVPRKRPKNTGAAKIKGAANTQGSSIEDDTGLQKRQYRTTRSRRAKPEARTSQAKRDDANTQSGRSTSRSRKQSANSNPLKQDKTTEQNQQGLNSTQSQGYNKSETEKKTEETAQATGEIPEKDDRQKPYMRLRGRRVLRREDTPRRGVVPSKDQALKKEENKDVTKKQTMQRIASSHDDEPTQRAVSSDKMSNEAENNDLNAKQSPVRRGRRSARIDKKHVHPKNDNKENQAMNDNNENQNVNEQQQSNHSNALTANAKATSSSSQICDTLHITEEHKDPSVTFTQIKTQVSDKAKLSDSMPRVKTCLDLTVKEDDHLGTSSQNSTPEADKVTDQNRDVNTRHQGNLATCGHVSTSGTDTFMPSTSAQKTRRKQRIIRRQGDFPTANYYRLVSNVDKVTMMNAAKKSHESQITEKKQDQPMICSHNSMATADTQSTSTGSEAMKKGNQDIAEKQRKRRPITRSNATMPAARSEVGPTDPGANLENKEAIVEKQRDHLFMAGNKKMPITDNDVTLTGPAATTDENQDTKAKQQSHPIAGSNNSVPVAPDSFGATILSKAPAAGNGVLPTDLFPKADDNQEIAKERHDNPRRNICILSVPDNEHTSADPVLRTSEHQDTHGIQRHHVISNYQGDKGMLDNQEDLESKENKDPNISDNMDLKGKQKEKQLACSPPDEATADNTAAVQTRVEGRDVFDNQQDVIITSSLDGHAESEDTMSEDSVILVSDNLDFIRELKEKQKHKQRRVTRSRTRDERLQRRQARLNLSIRPPSIHRYPIRGSQPTKQEQN